MPKVTTEVSYEDEEFGRDEYLVYSRQVEDLDIYDWLWYMIKQSELLGFDIEDIQVFTSDGKAYRTEP